MVCTTSVCFKQDCDDNHVDHNTFILRLGCSLPNLKLLLKKEENSTRVTHLKQHSWSFDKKLGTEVHFVPLTLVLFLCLVNSFPCQTQGTGWHSQAYCSEDFCNTPPTSSSTSNPVPLPRVAHKVDNIHQAGFPKTPVMILILTIVVIIATVVILACILKK